MTDASRKPSLQSLAALSHEFRTPLNGVLGMAELLEQTRLTAEQKAYVAVLRQSGDHLLSLVNDLLDLAKMEAGALSLAPAPMDPAQLLQSVCELLSPRAYAKGLEIAWSTPSDLPTIVADEGRLRQVLFNLAGNAIKFTAAGGALLHIQWRPAGRRARMRFLVSDTGPGIAADQQARIFEAFEQGAADAARADSTGLGLAVVRRLAEAHEGQVGVDSAPGEGAAFWFEADFDLAAPPSAAQPLKGVSVIAVSENTIVREAARAQVEAAGGRAVACASIADASVVANAETVVLVDHPLVKKDGCLAPLGGAACIVLVAPEQRAAISHHRAAGFSGYLIKPLRAASLVERVLTVLGFTAAAERKDERAALETAPGARVLLVEDHPINALLARKLLEREGCQVDWVTSGDMALAAAGTGHDLILMDRRMPGMDGLETTRRLRLAGVAAPIVALTADAFDEDRRLCLEAGMDEFLVKPLDPASLRSVLSRALSGGWTNAAQDAKLAS